MRYRSLLIRIFFSCLCISMLNQTGAAQDTRGTPEARGDDVASIDAIVAAVYDVISGPAGQKRDWDRMRSLFVPGARLIPVAQAGELKSARILSVEDYIAR